MEKCEFCNKEVKKYTILEVFHPFDQEPNSYLLCESCRDNSNDIYFIHYCESCNRHIYHSNGLRINVRVINGGYECVKCLQSDWLKNGMKEFKDADFFNYSDLQDNGFKLHDNYFCRSDKSYKDVETIFNKLKNSGKKVIVNIDSSGLGLEHHISLYIK